MLNEELITGYQWSPDDNKFMGEYRFPNNKDKEEIHLPPLTTLKKPPEVDKKTSAYWDGNEWIVKIDLSKTKGHPEIDNYETLMPDYIEWLKTQDLWSDEDQIQYEYSLQKINEKEEERVKNEQEIQNNRDYWEELRRIRNFILQQSDWTQLSDVQNIITLEEKQKWDLYRQELRDLLENITDPKQILLDPKNYQWPTPPRELNIFT